MKAKVTICRSSDDIIRIYIEDVASRIEFVEAAMSPDAFGRAVTGLSSQPADIKLDRTEHVGKQLVREERTVKCPIKTYDREQLRAWLRENMQEEGWILCDYLGSKCSVLGVDDGTWLNYSVSKYV